MPGRSLNPKLLGVAIVALLAWPGCGSSDEKDPSSGLDSAEVRAPRAAAEQCMWDRSRGDLDERAVRSTFADTGEGALRLLLSADTVRPGEVLRAAVLNETDSGVRYGTYSHIERPDGTEVEIEGPYGFSDVAPSADASSVGPCVSIPVPSSTPEGDYFAVVVGVSAADTRKGGRDQGESLRAPFSVAGTPVANPRWEARLDRAGDRSRRATASDETRPPCMQSNTSGIRIGRCAVSPYRP